MPKSKKSTANKSTHSQYSSGIVGQIPLDDEDNEAKIDKKQFSRRAIVNNWSKYQEDFTTEDLDHSDSQDFAYLIQNSSSDSNYFRLTSEKEWDKQALTQDSELFSLDLKLLSSGLACLPFYERIGLDYTKLSAENVNFCDIEAKNNVFSYKKILDKHKLSLAPIENKPAPANDTGSDLSSKVVIDTTSNTPLDVASCNSENSTSVDLKEMEDWLDDILGKD